MKKISKQEVRSKTATNVLACLRMEALTPSDFVVTGLHEIMAGKKTSDELLQEIMRHPVTVRRV